MGDNTGPASPPRTPLVAGGVVGTPTPSPTGGSRWYDGAGAPPSSLGSPGDYYLDDATGNYYVKGSGGYTLRGNLRGGQGVMGNGVHLTPGAPASSLGLDGDSAVDTASASFDFYARAGGAWTKVGALRGPAGHSPALAWGTGADADRVTVDGVGTGPHLTGPPGPPGSGVPGSSGGFDVTVYGAASGGSFDSTPGFAAAAAAAAAEVLANSGVSNACSSVTVPRGSFALRHPVILADGVSVLGTPGAYVTSLLGPAFVAGHQTLAAQGLDPASFRVSSDAHLDASLQGRSGFSSAAGAVACFWAHPFQVGGPPPGSGVSTPDYWQSTRVLTIAFKVTVPADYPWTASHIFAGSVDARQIPNPWYVGTTPFGVPGFSLHHLDADLLDANGVPLGQWRVHQATGIDGTLGTYEVVIQYDTTTATCAIWVNNVRQVVTTLSEGGGVPSTSGVALAPCDGASPFVVGSSSGYIPPAGSATPIPMVLHGLKVDSGPVYLTTGATGSAEAFAPSGPSGPVNDANRFYTLNNNATTRTVARLDLSVAAADWLVTGSPDRGGVGWVVTPGRSILRGGGHKFRDLYVLSDQCPLMLGSCLGTGVSVEDCTLAGGYRTISSMTDQYSQPVTINRCLLSAIETCYQGHWQFLVIENSSLSGYQRSGIILAGCEWTLRNVNFNSANSTAPAIIRALDYEYSQEGVIEGVNVDNEGGAPAVFVEFHQGSFCITKLKVDGLDIASTGNGSATIFSLIGAPPVDALPAWVDIRAVTDFSANADPASPVIHCDGSGQWFGTADLRSLPYFTTTGTGMGGITVLHR